MTINHKHTNNEQGRTCILHTNATLSLRLWALVGVSLQNVGNYPPKLWGGYPPKCGKIIPPKCGGTHPPQEKTKTKKGKERKPPGRPTIRPETEAAPGRHFDDTVPPRGADESACSGAVETAGILLAAKSQAQRHKAALSKHNLFTTSAL